MNTFAAQEGAYFGLGAGYTSINTPDFKPTVLNGTYKQDIGGYGGRLFAGYNINENFGFEAGYAKYADSDYSLRFNTGESETITYQYYAFDVVAKGYLPLNEKFDIYALGGFAYANSKVKAVEKAGGSIPSISGSKTTNKVLPKFGLGLDYAINNHWKVGAEASQITGTGDIKTDIDAVPDANMVALTLSFAS